MQQIHFYIYRFSIWDSGPKFQWNSIYFFIFILFIFLLYGSAFDKIVDPRSAVDLAD